MFNLSEQLHEIASQITYYKIQRDNTAVESQVKYYNKKIELYESIRETLKSVKEKQYERN